MFRAIFVCYLLLVLFCVDRGTLGQADKISRQPHAPATPNIAGSKRLSFVRARNARDYAISTVKGIDEGSYVTVGGIEQWVTIRGEDRSWTLCG